MVSIFNYFDYQKYLADYYEARKKEDPYFTYRFMASKVGIDHAFIIKIVQGQKHLSLESAERFSVLFNHNKREREYFELMVLFARAKTDREIKGYFEKLLSYVEFHPLKIEGYKYEFYKKWYYTAIREVIGFSGDGNCKKLAQAVMPSITEAQARHAVDLLEKLKFIQKREDGGYTLVTRFITPSEEVAPIAIKEFQKETMELAIRALHDIPKEDRSISTVTLSLSENGADKLKQCIDNFRHEVMRIADQDSEVSRVYQVNVQLYPMSKPHSGSKNEKK